MYSIRKISLGTANFDQNYGVISNNKAFTLNKISKILKESKKLKIDTIDTSYTYGSVEKKLGNFNLKSWKVTTQLPKLNLSSGLIEEQIFNHALSSINRLNIKYLDCILVSDLSQIFSKNGNEIIKGLCKLKKEGITKKIGFSVYFPNETEKLLKIFTPDAIQIPYSIIDRRFEKNNLIKRLYNKNIKIYVRSIFLQGLLLTNISNRHKYFEKKWKNTFNFWDNYLKKNNLNPVEVCLSYVLKNKYIYKAIVGLSSRQEVENSIKVLNKKIIFPKSFCNDENLLIPYKWKIKSMKFYLSTLHKEFINRIVKKTKKRLILALPCRATGTRLYGKPNQYIDIDKKVTIVEQLINCIKKIRSVSDIVMGISYGNENKIFQKIAKKKSLKFIYGKELDPLGRIIQCGKKAKATDILRITSECPFPYFNLIDEYWKIHKKTSADATFLENIIDGCGFEIISLSSLIQSHKNCKTIKQSEFSTWYIRKNYKKFNINKFLTPKELRRKDLRLAVDYPEDLALCRIIYKKFIKDAPMFNVKSIVRFLDRNPQLKNMVKPYVGQGYSKMYKWGKGVSWG